MKHGSVVYLRSIYGIALITCSLGLLYLLCRVSSFLRKGIELRSDHGLQSNSQASVPRNNCRTLSRKSLLLIEVCQRSTLSAGFSLLCLIHLVPTYQMNIEMNATHLSLWFLGLSHPSASPCSYLVPFHTPPNCPLLPLL